MPGPRRYAAIGLALALSAEPALAHGSLAERLAELDRGLAADPRSATLWIERASLLRAEGRSGEALADLARAERAGADRATLDRERGLALLAGRRPDEAEAALTRWLARTPDDAVARAARASAQEALGRHREAAGEYARALADAPQSPAAPEWWVGRARALTATTPPDFDAAIRTLDDAAARLGPAPAFEQTALALEIRAGRTDAALARLARMANATPRPEGFLVQRAELLESAGRRDEAAAAYGAALAALEDLPPGRRATPAAASLAARAREAIARLARGENR